MRRGFVRQPGLFDVADNADHCHPALVEINQQTATQRVFTRPVPFSESLVNEDDARRARTIALSNGAASQQGDAQQLEITGADDLIIGYYCVGHTLRLWPAFDLVNLDATPAGER